MKYIDAEKLKKLIDEKWKDLADKNVKVGGGKYDIDIYTYLSVLRLIDSLQQEQPVVDLENEIDMEWTAELLSREEYAEIARHFYELGQSEMRKRITNPQYNQEVIAKMKSEYPVDEFNARKEE